MERAAQQVSAFHPAVLERASRVIRVVGHPLRLRLLELLEGGERNVTDLMVSSGVSQARVSQQLRILRTEGIVDDRREGGRVFYRIIEPKVTRILDCIRECDIADLLEPSSAPAPDLRVLPGTSDGGPLGHRRPSQTSR
jgi:DNA-binding transcriptional ArsR family regulator